jgi:hypothetical protein
VLGAAKCHIPEQNQPEISPKIPLDLKTAVKWMPCH